MIIGMQEDKPCPICGSDARWVNNDLSWGIICAGFCEKYFITQKAVQYISNDNVRRLCASELVRTPGLLKTPLTPGILADYAKNRYPKDYYQEHFSTD